jgi:hypothetical protein
MQRVQRRIEVIKEWLQKVKAWFTGQSEIKKYVVRFGVVLILAVPVMALVKGWEGVRIAGYKLALAAIAVGLAELIWATFFKPVFGKAETGGLNNETSMAVMAFRGLLYASIILALCLGL